MKAQNHDDDEDAAAADSDNIFDLDAEGADDDDLSGQITIRTRRRTIRQLEGIAKKEKRRKGDTTRAILDLGVAQYKRYEILYDDEITYFIDGGVTISIVRGTRRPEAEDALKRLLKVVAKEKGFQIN